MARDTKKPDARVLVAAGAVAASAAAAGTASHVRARRRAEARRYRLGDDHDLATLLEASRERPAVLSLGERELLEGLIERRRAELRGEALKRAGKLYAPKPRKLARLVS